MNLHSFTQYRAGCIFEINGPINVVPRQSVVFVLDDSTSKEFLDQTVEDISSRLTARSPNFGMITTKMALFEMLSIHPNEIERLMLRLCQAAASGK